MATTVGFWCFAKRPNQHFLLATIPIFLGSIWVFVGWIPHFGVFLIKVKVYKSESPNKIMQRFLDVFGAPSPVTSARKSPSSSASRAKRPNRSCCRTGAVLGGLVTWVKQDGGMWPSYPREWVCLCHERKNGNYLTNFLMNPDVFDSETNGTLHDVSNHILGCITQGWRSRDFPCCESGTEHQLAQPRCGNHRFDSLESGLRYSSNYSSSDGSSNFIHRKWRNAWDFFPDAFSDWDGLVEEGVG